MFNVRDPKLLGSLEPEAIAHYLSQHHWKSIKIIANGLAQIWRLESETPLEIILPLDHELGDFALRMTDVIETIAQAENRTKIEVLGDCLTVVHNASIQGMVTRLQENADSGKVTLMGVIAGQLRRVQMDLAEPAYDLAIKAYQARIPVICQGELTKHSSGFVLSRIEKFTLDLEVWIAESA